uniref:trypsin n=1 Tax=Labrus bergylta TaxID=56723 RepID=A0A3Q3EGG7_9LABR
VLCISCAAMLQLKVTDRPYCAKETRFVKTACLPHKNFDSGTELKDVCENVRCGRGDCVVNLKRPPFYECKCTPPYYGPNCRSFPTSPCVRNPCKNGGSCVARDKRLSCACPNEFTGRFCQTGKEDCYIGNGESYRGAVSVTEGGMECLDWNSYFILSQGEDPFTMYSDFPGLGYNNDCRNPDNDDKPWCYYKKQGRLEWDFCKINKCSEGNLKLPVSTLFSQCGKVDLGTQPVRTGRIYGGTKSYPGAHPWQVSLQAKLRGSSFQFTHFCGGILLSSCWVLTAAHCINNENEYQVVLGGVHLEKQEQMDQTIPVIQTIVHENYRETPVALYNDIALLKLKITEAPYCAKETRFVRAACLPDQAFPAGKECVISGWGATENQRYSPQLLNARVFMISDRKCRSPEVYGSVLNNSMICAGTLRGGIDSCQVDLWCVSRTVHIISGVVSWGDDCGKKNKPGVYANIHAFTDWINRKMNWK